MAEPARLVETSNVSADDRAVYHKFTGTVVNYYPGQLIGRGTNGYLASMNDSASLAFVGTLAQETVEVNSTTAGAFKGRIETPWRLVVPLYSGTAKIIDDPASPAASDIGKIAYAKEGGNVVLSPVGLTYANPVGTVVDVKKADSPGALSAATHVVLSTAIAPYKAVRIMSATGTQSLTQHDVGKTILLPNTAAHTLNLPALALVPEGMGFDFQKTTSDAAAVTIDGSGSETINGSTTFAGVDAQYDFVSIRKGIVGGSPVWLITAKNIA